MKELSKDEMKKVMGGMYTPPQPPPNNGNSCNVTCASEYYACCNTGMGVPECNCHPNGSAYGCLTGGIFESECSVTMN